MTSRSDGPALSIVVPTVDDIAALEETLVSVLENRPDDCEIVVPIACRYDDPWNIAEEVRFVAAPPHAGFASCANLGIAASRGRVIHVLAAGWRATHGWADAALARFDGESFSAGGVAAVVPLVVSATDARHVVSAGVRLTRGGRRVRVVPRRARRDAATAGVDVSRLRPSAPVLQAGFWRADVLAATGEGFATACGTEWCDADMGVTIEAIGGRVVIADDARVVEGARVPTTRGFADGLNAERVFWRSLSARSLLPSLVLHVWEVLRSAVVAGPLGTVPTLLGRAVALLQFGHYVAHAHRMRGIRTAMTVEVDDAPTTVRIDEPHASVAPPHRRRRGESQFRKSA